jgi:hypothetical protein
MSKLIDVVLCYDFDGTLAGGNMQEPGFLKKLGISPKEFWEKSDKMAEDNNADNNLCYMRCMLEEAKSRKVAFRREDFVESGKEIKFFPGVEDWFDRINEYALKKGVRLTHYLISSGLQEIAEGTSIASHFAKIYASTFMYNEYGEAFWPARVVDYTGKTQYLFRISKGCLDVSDNKKVNDPMPATERPIPFRRMIYLGDGDTDIPCMAMIKRFGGHCIAVYHPNKKGAELKAQKYYDDGRANIVAPADYRSRKKIDTYVKNIIDYFAAEHKLQGQ